MSARRPIGYVVEIDGPFLLLNVLEDSRGHVAGHRDGLSTVEQPGDLIGVEAGAELIVVRIMTVAYAEPKEVHIGKERKHRDLSEPLRQIKGRVIGFVVRRDGKLRFYAQDWRLPVLGASVFPLSDDETVATIGASDEKEENKIRLGSDSRNRNIGVKVSINDLLGRHLAVLGATGQGKTHFIAAVLQALLAMPRSRIVVFDVNGEYGPAFENLGVRVRKTVLGGQGQTGLRIPYYALGRHGLARLLLPSERAQMPALRFAIEHLINVEADGAGAKAVGLEGWALFDDCHTGHPANAKRHLDAVRAPHAQIAGRWPHMRALACLATEWYVIKAGRQNNFERDHFLYGHIQGLINRIRGLIEDPQFSTIVDVTGAPPVGDNLSLRSESAALVERIFGRQQFDDEEWLVHVVDLSNLTQDLMPFVLGSLLEMFAAELFLRGPGNTHPTMLVLEEAHHYLRQLSGDADSGQHVLAYERLAKEGRKFGLSLLVSTQRPSEVSSTVLAQCGTWSVFRLSNDADQRSVAAAAESAGVNVARQLAGLGRGEAIVFGAALPVPTRMNVVRPNPEPDSMDPPFLDAWSSVPGEAAAPDR